MNDPVPGVIDGHPQPKIEAASLSLRVPPPRAVRFRRGLILTLSALGAGGVMVVAVMALNPSHHEGGQVSQSEPQIASGHLPDLLAKAPASYADMAKPGNTPTDPAFQNGSPTLQASFDAQPMPRGFVPVGSATGSSAFEEAQTSRRAARSSAVLVALHPISDRQGVVAATSDEGAGSAGILSSPELQNAREGQPHMPSSNRAQGGQTALGEHAIVPPVSPWVVSAGTIISASLITGVNSDLPGEVTAQVTQNVFDSATGNVLLIPQGARLIGRTGDTVAYGQTRAVILWHRLLFPDGSSLDLDKQPAADAMGHAGLSDQINNHSWALIKGIALSTLLGVGTELSFGESDGRLVRALRESTEANADRASQQITSKNLDVHPTLSVRPGWPVTIIVDQDLVLRPWS